MLAHARDHHEETQELFFLFRLIRNHRSDQMNGHTQWSGYCSLIGSDSLLDRKNNVRCIIQILGLKVVSLALCGFEDDELWTRDSQYQLSKYTTVSHTLK